MRHIYKTSGESVMVLSGGRELVAENWGVGRAYIDQICSGHVTDPYAPFRMMFEAAAYAGLDIFIWMNDLASIAMAAQAGIKRKAGSITSMLLKKIDIDARETKAIVDALGTERTEGESRLTEQDCDRILAFLDQSEKARADLKQMILTYKGDHYYQVGSFPGEKVDMTVRQIGAEIVRRRKQRNG